jgi:ribosomal subunit interface protein
MAVQVNVTGKNMSLGDDLESFIRDKFQRLSHFVRPTDYVDVVVVREPTREIQGHFVTQANVVASGSLVLRGEERAADPRDSIDALVDQLESRMSRQHGFIESERRVTAQGKLPPTPEEAYSHPSTLESVLGDRGIDDDTIHRLQASGILTLEQLRAAVDDGRLHARLGPRFRHEEHELVKIVEQFRA